jgi:hypothetical protein
MDEAPAAAAALRPGLGAAIGAHPVAEALEAMAAAVDELAGLPLSSLSDAGLDSLLMVCPTHNDSVPSCR